MARTMHICWRRLMRLSFCFCAPPTKTVTQTRAHQQTSESVFSAFMGSRVNEIPRY